MKKVLLTGATGFIGSHLKRRLLTLGYQVIGLSSTDGDISEGSFWKNFAGEDIENVYHLAARTFVPDSWQVPEQFFAVNTSGTQYVLEFCRRRNAGLTYISSYLYGQPDTLPISEDSPIKSNNPYAFSKYMAEQLCRFYAQEYQVPVSVIRPFNVYGCGQAEKFLIPSIIRQAIYDPDIKVKDLQPKRDYVYVEDLVDAIIASTDTWHCCGTYNIGSGYSLSVAQVIELVQNILGTRKPVISEKVERHNEIQDVIADISKANRELNWFPRYSIIDGLKEVIDYVQRS